MKKYRPLYGILTAAAVTAVMLPVAAFGAGEIYTECKTGSQDGYDFELWKDNGNTSMTLLGNGAFSCEWNNINNCLFRTGKKFDCTQTYQEIGNITLDYECDYHPDGNSYLCCYGWTKEPLIEYYIVEDWGNWRPPGGDAIGRITVDGATYDVYKTLRENKPSIIGDATFYQYWSVRTDAEKQSSGTMHVTDHFAAWEEMGLQMGKLYEVALNVEGYQSAGKATVTKNIVTISDNPDETVPTEAPTEPADGYYLHEDFENGTGKWSGRGDAKVAVSPEAVSGKNSLAVTGRTDNWNGAAFNLSNKEYLSGNAYSFSVMAMQEAAAAEHFKLTLQYNIGEKVYYAAIAEADAGRGEWVQLANPSFTIPEHATGMILYLESDSKTNDFYLDDAAVAVDGTVIESSSAPAGLMGDVDKNGKIEILDIISLQKYLHGKEATVYLETADLNQDNVLNIFDLILLKRMMIQENTSAVPVLVKPQSGTEYMNQIQESFTAAVPAEVFTKSAGRNYGTLEKINYYSTIAKKQKQANVLLPPDYDASKQYPVLYVNHGIFGDCNSLTDDSMGIIAMAGNLAASGEAVPMIIVFTSMYTSETSDQCAGFTAEETAKYDAFREDITECLMPYINEHYAVKTGRENTAISGFSMGGRETLYIGMTKPEYFGYIGAACPAPGIVPAQDAFMQHTGNMQPEDFKISGAVQPVELFIAGGTNDTVVRDFPQQYHALLTQNGQPHLWLEVNGGGHDGSTVVPMYYNFLKTVFKN